MTTYQTASTSNRPLQTTRTQIRVGIQSIIWLMVLLGLFNCRMASAQDTDQNLVQLLEQFSKIQNMDKKQGVIQVGSAFRMIGFTQQLSGFPSHGSIDKGEHYQGIARYKNAIYLTSSYKKIQDFEGNIPRVRKRGGRLLVVENRTERARSIFGLPNFLVRSRKVHKPVAIKEIWDDEIVDTDEPYWHYGGADVSNGILAIGVHAGFKKSAVHLYDISSPLRPKFLQSVPIPELYDLGAVGITKSIDGTWLVAVNGLVYDSDNVFERFVLRNGGKLSDKQRISLAKQFNKPAIRVYGAGQGQSPHRNWELLDTFEDKDAYEYQGLSLVTTSDDSIVMFGTYNSGKLMNKPGAPLGENRVRMRVLYRGGVFDDLNRRLWKIFGLKDRAFELWYNYEAPDLDVESGFSIASFVGSAAAFLTGPAGAPLAAILAGGGAAGTASTVSQLKKAYSHPNFDGCGCVIINEQGNLEIWSAAHGNDDRGTVRFSFFQK